MSIDLSKSMSAISFEEERPDPEDRIGAPGDVKRGDYVYAEWMTPSRETKWIRGLVVDMKNSSVWIQYYWEHNNGGLCHFGIKTARRQKFEVRRTPRLPGELLPSEYVDRRMRTKEFPDSLSIADALHQNELRRRELLRATMPQAGETDG